MTDTVIASRFTKVGLVFVPVADQDRALEFYLDKLWFEKRADFRGQPMDRSRPARLADGDRACYAE